jgi:hypothetical protein
MNHHTDPEPPAYQWNGPFCYSLRCQLCRDERPHTHEEHDALRFGWEIEDYGL